MNQTKIIATLGPASSSKETVQALIEAGVNLFRLNLSHGTHQEHQGHIQLIRQVAKDLDRPVGLLADLQGPKFRTGPLKGKEPINLEVGEEVKFTTETRETEPGVIGTKYPQIVEAVEKGSTILINDGKIRLRVLKKQNKQTVVCLSLIHI